MEFSKSESLVMEMLWEGKCLDENGEIQALELSKHLSEKYGWGKTSCYTFFARLLEKGAISRRYPKYTLKPIVTREEALKNRKKDAINNLFQGSIVKLFSAFLTEKKVTKEELKEMKDLIERFEEERE
ncbi:MAG: BlaI/MecI/CopY family transcriptional regulator [Peptostreptococcaceae bacterium]|nr:BlaI/MecI/CopY family transcriptional regulator [Peptostreptococcaceae bacterium]